MPIHSAHEWKSSMTATHWECQIHSLFIHDPFLVSPYVLEETVHDSYTLIPYELIVRLRVVSVSRTSQHEHVSNKDHRVKRTSEKAGAAIFLCRFHSSASVATILSPKKVTAPYCSTGLGKRPRWVVISCSRGNWRAHHSSKKCN